MTLLPQRRAALLVLACAWTADAAAQDGAPVQPAPIVAPAHVAADAPDGGAGNALAALNDLSTPVRTVLLLSLLTLLPGMMLTLTSYTRIIIVLSFVRRAIGAPELPPGPILVGMALFLTAAVMSPTVARIHEGAVAPYLEGQMDLGPAAQAAADELKGFMLLHTREDDLALSVDLAGVAAPASPEDTPFRVAVPAFVLSELRTAFRMGFIIFLPFLLIDVIVAAVLLALGMFMLPPTMIAMPLKILLFILVDGWSLIVQSLALSFGTT